MSEKPSYLGLLNAIAVGERGGEELFEAWACGDAERRRPRRAADGRPARGRARLAFAKRINELGYSVHPQGGPEAGRPRRPRRAHRPRPIARSSSGSASASAPGDTDIFGKFFDDMTMDVQTGALMGRYVAEERDTGRQLRACYAQSAGRAPAQQRPHRPDRDQRAAGADRVRARRAGRSGPRKASARRGKK